MDQQWGKLVLLFGGGGSWSVAYRVFLIHCRSLKIWMKLLLGTFSQWRHLPGICWGISTSRSATGEAGRYVYWGFFCDIVLIIELWAVCLFCLGLHILSCSSCSLSVRKWKSCWCGQRGRSPPSSLTLFQHAKIYQENSSWATNHVQNHGKRKCLFPTFMKENVKSDV